MAEDIRRVCVMGAGAMGRQIALVCALAGYEVTVHDAAPPALADARTWLDGYLAERVAKGKLAAAEAAAANSRLQVTADPVAAARGADLVIEAIIEKLDVKRELFAFLDQTCPRHAILATNSSTIVSSQLADATTRPDKVLNMHFFNPALVMELVEVVRGPHTSEETASLAMAFAERIGKYPILLAKEISGFVVNRILGAITSEAMNLLANGVATAREIDEAVVRGLRHPIGPFRLMDLTGIDVAYLVRMQRYQESGDPRDRPHDLLRARYEAGAWGKKTGKGWYEY